MKKARIIAEGSLKEKKTCNLLDNGQIEALEDFMLAHNLHFSKTDIFRAARELGISTKSALMHFQAIKEELAKEGIESNVDFLRKIRKLEKKINSIHKIMKNGL
ncbi:hypothetical protein GINT2_001232 [Glugoides intestinalis]